jgi:hypothetical protein
VHEGAKKQGDSSEGGQVKILLLAVSLFAVWPMSSGKQYHMTATNSVPGAAGIVKVQKDKDNGNTKLNIKVEHLANPASLTPSENAYVVWVQPRGEEAVKLGAIGVDKNLKGELNVVTTSKDFDVFVTAEQSQNVSTPSEFTVLQAHVSP